MCVCVLACQNCLFPCNRVVYLSIISCIIPTLLISKILIGCLEDFIIGMNFIFVDFIDV